MKAWIISKFSNSRWLLLDILAIIVGISGGLIAVLFRKIVDLIHSFFFGPVFAILPGRDTIGEARLILLPILGALVIGPVLIRLIPEARGDGIPEVIESIQMKGGRIRKRLGILLMLTSTITIGSGGSAGSDSPTAQIGAAFGSFTGQIMRLTVGDIQTLALCGLVAGLAGTFNAPLGCAIFGMEVITRRFRLTDTVPVLLSSVIGAAVGTAILGEGHAIDVTGLSIPLKELWLCIVLGLALGMVSFLWVRLFYGAESLFDRLPLRRELKPALGGVVAGIGGMYFLDYGIMGVGYDGINRVVELIADSEASSRPELLLLLISLGIVKALATASSLGSGGSGGAIAPTLYVGTMFGGAVGIIYSELIPSVGGHTATYALIGAGAFFAGVARAPLTCIVLIPEMAANYAMLPPMMFSCAMSYAVAHILLGGSSIYALRLEKKGVPLEIGEAVLDRVLVRDAMARDVVSVSPDMTIKEVRDYVTQYNYRGFPVVDGGELVGIIAFDNIRKIPEEKQEEIRVGNVAVRNVICAYPDENMKQVMDRLYENNVGRLPVVERKMPKKLIGIVTRTDAIYAYENYMAKKS